MGRKSFKLRSPAPESAQRSVAVGALSSASTQHVVDCPRHSSHLRARSHQPATIRSLRRGAVDLRCTLARAPRREARGDR